jgi:hypothetical protein
VAGIAIERLWLSRGFASSGMRAESRGKCVLVNTKQGSGSLKALIVSENCKQSDQAHFPYSPLLRPQR